MLKITTKDGKTVEVTQDIKGMAGLVEDALMDNDKEEIDFPLTDVNEKELKVLVEYATHHKFAKKSSDIKQPLENADMNKFIKDEWDREFIKKFDHNEKAELLMAANTINMQAMLELCAAVLASEFKGKDFEKIKGDLGLGEVTYTPEDDDKLMDSCAWIMGAPEKKVQALINEHYKKGSQV